jgi:uridylate kinase
VYDKDPAKHDDAKHIPTLTFDEAVSNSQIQVMDQAALGLAMDHKLPIIVFNPLTDMHILNVTSGKSIGTKIG